MNEMQRMQETLDEVVARWSEVHYQEKPEMTISTNVVDYWRKSSERWFNRALDNESRLRRAIACARGLRRAAAERDRRCREQIAALEARVTELEVQLNDAGQAMFDATGYILPFAQTWNSGDEPE